MQARHDPDPATVPARSPDWLSRGPLAAGRYYPGMAGPSVHRTDGRASRFQHRRPELLAAATEYVLDHGVADLSLRPMATALGVTHATLIRHFGSKENLITEVVDRVREDFLAALQTDAGILGAGSATEFLVASWDKMRQPAEQRQFRTLFEVASRATHHSDLSSAVLGRITQEWLTPLEHRLVADGRTAAQATALATLAVAQVRGLQLDLLLSGDRDRVDAAFDVAMAQLRRSLYTDDSSSAH